MICIRKSNLTVIYLLLSLLTLVSSTASIQAGPSKVPFHPGEKLTFILKWEMIPAGEATLEVLPMEIFKGVKSYHFVLTAKSNNFIDIFYKVRDRIDAYTDAEVSRSLFYKKKQREGSHKRDVTVDFNWKKKEAQYTFFGKKEKAISILPGTFDPLSAFYFTRFIDNRKVNTFIERPVTDGKKIIMGRAYIKKRETIKVQSGTYDTFLVEPEIKDLGGVFKKSKDAKIQVWVTADHRHMPVQIKSKVVVGSFIGELVSARGIK